MRKTSHIQTIAFCLCATLVCLPFGNGFASLEKPTREKPASVDAAAAKPLEILNESNETSSKNSQRLSDRSAEKDPASPQKQKLRPQPGLPPCFSPFVGDEGRCTLDGDVSIKNTIRLPANMTLDCDGHKILPQSDGGGKSKSTPEVGILIDHVRNVVIQNCAIEGFDFGIFAVNSKAELSSVLFERPRNIVSPAQRKSMTSFSSTSILPNLIQGNTIHAHFTGISLFSVDNTEISGNTINFPLNGGRGLVVERNSDNNLIQSNFFIATDEISTNPVRVPGPVVPATDPTLSTNPVLTASSALTLSGGAVLIAQIGGDEPTLLNAIIEGHLYQLTTTDIAEPLDTNGKVKAEFTQDNQVEGNHIIFPHFFPDATDGIGLAVPQNTIVHANEVHQAATGIRVGVQFAPPKQFPSQCISDPSRLCFQNSDCQILGGSGNCAPLPGKTALRWISNGTDIIGNTIEGPFVGGILVSGKGTTVKDNTINGPLTNCDTMKLPQGVACPGAITIFGSALNSSVITQNTVSNTGIALSLISQFQGSVPSCSGNTISCLANPSCLGIQIYLNDFLVANQPIAVQTDNSYAFSTDLSLGGRGNYWGQPCFDPTQVQKLDISSNSANVMDCNSYPMSVAKATQVGFPQPCP